jgi:histidine triad (HIT) family protein
MNDCIFCKIASGSIPSSKVYENDDTLSFLDINPASKGHLLIIPKKHRENISELTEKEVLSFFNAVKKITEAMPDVLDASEFNVLMNHGKNAGQVINHVHFHIIPRRKEDGLSMSKWPFQKYSGEHLNEIAGRFRESIRNR